MEKIKCNIDGKEITLKIFENVPKKGISIRWKIKIINRKLEDFEQRIERLEKLLNEKP